MRIIGISPSDKRLRDMREALTGQDVVGGFVGYSGTLQGQSGLPAQGGFDVLVLDCVENGEAELGALGRLQPLYPGLQTVLVAPPTNPELLLQALRLGVREVVSPELDRSEFQAALRRVGQAQQGGTTTPARIIAFVSCKGGSGSTFIATNLGYSLAAQEKKRVLLIDLNLQFGDAALFVSDKQPSSTLADVCREIERVDAAFLQSCLVEVLPNYGVLAAPSDPTQSVEIRPSHIEAILRIAKAHWDYIILDAGRTLDPVSIRALDLADYVMPVLQLTLPFIRDGKRLLDLLRSLDYPAEKIRPLVNRFEKSPELTIADLERTLGTKVFATIPNHYASVASSVNHGVPILERARSSPVTKALASLAHEFAAPRESTSGGGWLGRLFSRP